MTKEGRIITLTLAMRKSRDRDEFGLTQKQKDVLTHLIDIYIKRSEPVGSKTIAQEAVKDLSPATIRNYLEEMEEKGLLYKPHASAGRIPTEKGLKYYVKELMNKIEEREEEFNFLKERLCQVHSNYKELLKLTSNLLASLSHQVALVLLPRPEPDSITAIDFIRVAYRKVLVVVVFKVGMVENKIIETDTDFTQKELTNYSLLVNEFLDKGMTPFEIRDYILREMKELRALYDKLLSSLKELVNEQDLILEGQSNLLDAPEFASIEYMKKVFKAFEEKSKIVKLLDKTVKTKGVIAYIGKEDLHNELDSVAIVAAPYYGTDNYAGSIGIIGPMRMNYSNVIPLVGTAAKLISNLLKEGMVKHE